MFEEADFSALSGDWLKEETTDSDRYQDGHYCPIYIEPMVGSGERLCVGVVAATSESFLVARTPGLDRLRCFYDEAADFLLRVSEEVCCDLETRLQRHEWQSVGDGVPLAEFWKSPFEGFFTGGPNWASGQNAGEIADIGLQMCASLTGNRTVQENQKSEALTRTRLIEQVKSQVLTQKNWGKWFNAAARPFPSLRFDFLGQRLAAHIGIVVPNELQQHIYTAKSGAMDLHFLHSQDPKDLWQPIDERSIDKYSVLLHLDNNQIAKNGRQTKTQVMTDQFILASNNLGVEVHSCYSVEEIADKIIQLEAA